MRPKTLPKLPATGFGRGRSIDRSASKARGIRPSIFYTCFVGLFATNIVTLVGFLMAPDIAGLVSGQNDLVLAAYEDRVAELRIEVDRLHSRHYAQAGDINLQLQELSQQQEVLLEQHQFVKQLAEKAEELGIRTADVGSDEEPAEVAAVSVNRPALTPAEELIEVGTSVHAMIDESRMALAAITETATEKTTEILGELGAIGIKPKMPETDGEAVGGPFLPATDGPDSVSLVDEANAVFNALARFKAARSAVDVAPVHRPINGSVRVSSSFGNRKDPFTKGKAFHAGIDFPAPTGTTVLSAGYGKVSFVGQRSGYGNVVEVSHGAGLITRYAHLHSFLVKVGQTVGTGTPIAKVGSTGRSTGPHLHFEVRKKDKALDPTIYLTAGKKLKSYLAG